MSSTIKVQGLASMSTDGYLKPVYSGTTATPLAHITHRQTLVRTFAGTEELATTTAWVASTSTFDALDKIQLPSSTGGYTTRQLIAVEHYDDEDGHHHSKLSFG
jgi:hypothetical protein